MSDCRLYWKIIFLRGHLHPLWSAPPLLQTGANLELCILFKIYICSFVAVHLLCVFLPWFRTLFAFFVTHSARQINISCCKDTLIKVVIKRSPAYGYFFTVNSKYMAERLSFHYKRRYEVIKFPQFFWGHVYTCARLRKRLFVLLLGL